MTDNMEVDKLIFGSIFNRTQTVTNDWIEFKNICIKLDILKNTHEKDRET